MRETFTFEFEEAVGVFVAAVEEIFQFGPLGWYEGLQQSMEISGAEL